MSRIIVDDSYQGVINVTPDDNTDIAFPSGTRYSRAIYVGVSGDVAVKMADGTTSTLKSVPVGEHRFGVTRILATGTTATDIKAFY